MIDSPIISTGEFTGFLNHQQYLSLCYFQEWYHGKPLGPVLKVRLLVGYI